MVERFVLPEVLPFSPKECVGSVGTSAFDPIRNPGERDFRRNQYVNVIRHHHEGVQVKIAER